MELDGKRKISSRNRSVAVILMTSSLDKACFCHFCPPRLGWDDDGADRHPDGGRAGELLTTHKSATELSWVLQKVTGGLIREQTACDIIKSGGDCCENWR